MKLDYEDQLMVKHEKSVRFIKLSQITHIRASGENSYIYASTGEEYVTPKSMKEWEKKLPEKHFCRIHRAAIVNFDYVDKIDPRKSGTAEITLQGSSDRLIISRNCFRKLKRDYEF